VEHALWLLHDDRDFEAIAAVSPALQFYPAGNPVIRDP